MPRANPDAALDCLYLVNRLQVPLGSVTQSEIHLFAYLSCLLWLYSGRAVADWGYSFVGTDLGAPFSIELDTALQALEEAGHVSLSSDRVFEADLGVDALSELSDLELNHERLACLNAAYSSTLALSVGMVGTALSEDPELKRARLLPSTRRLLEESAVANLYDNFSILKQQLEGRDSDLRVPSVVWLQALYSVRQSEPV